VSTDQLPFPERARIAYATGWALTGAAPTERGRIACQTAVAHAIDHADEPGILETTLDLGALEGTWAIVYQRRDALYTSHIPTVAAAFRALLADRDPAPTITAVRARLGVTESTEDIDPGQDGPDEATPAFTAAILAWLLQAILPGAGHLTDDGRYRPGHSPSNDGDDTALQALRQVLADALQAAEREGWAGAVGIAAQQAGIAGIDWDLASSDAAAALAGLGNHWAEADAWITRILHGASTDLGQLLASLYAEAASHEDMVDAVLDALTNGDLRAVSTFVDMAMSQAMGRGSLALYAREGVRSVDWWTAADGRVCKRCHKIEGGNPYPLVEAPIPALHPFCRCALVPHNPLDPLRFAGYSVH
jgi:SPP1 gp7 family putative phage head morphogenesis protein